MRPPPQTLEDLEDLTGEPAEVTPRPSPAAATAHTATGASIAPSDRSKVHLSPRHVSLTLTALECSEIDVENLGAVKNKMFSGRDIEQNNFSNPTAPSHVKLRM